MRNISRFRRTASATCIAALLASCGGGGGGGTATPAPVIVAPPTGGTPTPAPSAGTCSLSSRLDWVTTNLRQDYLFPDLLATVPTAGVTDIQAYINAMTAPARAAGKDKLNFSYVTSIAEENALINSGSNAGLGIRLLIDGNRLFVTEAFEGAPGLAAGFDRGTEILAIGTNSTNLVAVSTLLGTSTGLGDALGPSDPGVSRTFRLRSRAGVETVVTAVKAEYALDPISDRYGASIINDGGRQIGYLNLRTFIVDSADPQLRAVFANFKAQNVTEVVIDLRYNGGGLVRLAELLTDLLGANRTSSDVQSRTLFNARNAANNRTAFFSPQPQSIAPTKIAFIATPGSTASASELVMNALLPYYGANVALIGGNTFGKPVGQIARDRNECDDRFRIMAFQTVNRDGQGDYFNGLAPFFQRTCRATDDYTRQLGDRSEASLSTALDFLAGRPCTAISGGVTTLSVGETRRVVRPEAPSAAQYEVPGLF